VTWNRDVWLAAEVVLETHDVVFTDVGSGQHLNGDDRFLALVLTTVRGAHNAVNNDWSQGVAALRPARAMLFA